MGLRPEGEAGGGGTRGVGPEGRRGCLCAILRTLVSFHFQIYPVFTTEQFLFSGLTCRKPTTRWDLSPVYTSQYKYSLQNVHYSCCHNKISSCCLLHPDPTTIDLCHTCWGHSGRGIAATVSVVFMHFSLFHSEIVSDHRLDLINISYGT